MKSCRRKTTLRRHSDLYFILVITGRTVQPPPPAALSTRPLHLHFIALTHVYKLHTHTRTHWTLLRHGTPTAAGPSGMTQSSGIASQYKQTLASESVQALATWRRRMTLLCQPQDIFRKPCIVIGRFKASLQNIHLV